MRCPNQHKAIQTELTIVSKLTANTDINQDRLFDLLRLYTWPKEVTEQFLNGCVVGHKNVYRTHAEKARKAGVYTVSYKEIQKVAEKNNICLNLTSARDLVKIGIFRCTLSANGKQSRGYIGFRRENISSLQLDVLKTHNFVHEEVLPEQSTSTDPESTHISTESTRENNLPQRNILTDFWPDRSVEEIIKL